MAVSQQNQTDEKWKNVIYINCQPDSLFRDKNDEMLSSIVDYTLKEMSNPAICSNAKELYQNYCNTLLKELGSSEPYHIDVDLKILTKDEIIKMMNKNLIHRMEKINSLIEKAADEVVEFLASNTDNNEKPYDQDENGIIVSKFALLKIFKSGENLEFVPCYMAVKEEKEEISGYFPGVIGLFQNSSTSKFLMEYKQQKFILYKNNIKAIISKLQKGNKSIETCTQSQISNLCNDWMYENCQPDLLIDTQKVSTIVNYAFKAMGISPDIRNAEESFRYYCSGLKNRLKSSEPFYTSIEIKEMKNDLIVKNLKQLLQGEKFDGLIEKAVTFLVHGININYVSRRQNWNEIVLSEFEVLRINKSGENLEIIPCYMAVKEEKKESKGYFQTSSTSKFLMEYKQQKFILSKFDVKEIIKKLQGEAKIND